MRASQTIDFDALMGLISGGGAKDPEPPAKAPKVEKVEKVEPAEKAQPGTTVRCEHRSCSTILATWAISSATCGTGSSTICATQ